MCRHRVACKAPTTRLLVISATYSIHQSLRTATLKPRPRSYQTTPETHRRHFLHPPPWLCLGEGLLGFPVDALEINHVLIGNLRSTEEKSDVLDVWTQKCCDFCSSSSAHDFAFFLIYS